MANATKTHTHKKPFSAKLLFRLGPFYTINTLLFCSFLFTVNVSNKTHAIKKSYLCSLLLWIILVTGFK